MTPYRASAEDALSAVLPFLCNSEGIVMVLGGYFDESERPTGGEPISVGGYLFKPKSYGHFVRKWARLLKSGPSPTTFFHMTDLYAGKKQYAEWSLADRVAHLTKAVEAVRKHAYIGTCAVFSQNDFERLAPDGWGQKYGGIYTVACQLAMATAVNCLKERSNDSTIAYVFERGNDYWQEVDKLLHGIAESPNKVEHYRYHSHTDLPKADAFGLQAADMLAWLETLNANGPIGTRTAHAFEPVVTGLQDGWGGRYWLWRFDEDSLRELFEAQDDRPDTPIVVDLRGSKRKRMR